MDEASACVAITTAGWLVLGTAMLYCFIVGAVVGYHYAFYGAK